MATETRKDNQDPKVHRLMGMVVNEVSLVDRAANKRVFLLMKRDPMADIKKDDAGNAPGDGLTPPEGSGSAPAEGGALSMQAQVKDQLLAAITSAGEKIISLGNMVKDATASDEPTDPAVPDSVVGAITEVAQMLTGIANQFGKGDAGDAGVGTGAPPAPPQSAGSQDTAKRELVQKVGRKMAKERLDRFRKAIDILAGLMKEIGSDTMAKRAGGRDVVVIEKAAAEELLSSVDGLQGLVRKQEAELVEVRAKNVELGRRVQDQGSMSIEKSQGQAKPVLWPSDLAPRSVSSSGASRA